MQPPGTASTRATWSGSLPGNSFRRGSRSPGGPPLACRQTEEALQAVEGGLRRLFAVLQEEEPPQVQVGSHCTHPYDCPIQGSGWAFLPERHVFLLLHGPAKAWDLLGKGILGLQEIPKDYPLTPRQAIQFRCEHTGVPHVDRAAIEAFLNHLRYPLYFLDFETFQTPIPLFAGLRPYDQVPFQFSLHVQQDPFSLEIV